MEARAQPDLKGSARLGSYLRRLRAGYGYSLRRVEERARAEGGEIDNSQLSRYEKGICYPSFEKLRVLASVFNVPIQAFADVVDLEVYEELRPESTDPERLLDEGAGALRAGEAARAFACYERALEVLETTSRDAEAPEPVGRARVHLALALHRLGKLSLSEQELRRVLREHSDMRDSLRAQAILNLANVHADQGDQVLAEMECERAHDVARRSGSDLLAARALHTHGRVLAELGEHNRAVGQYRRALEVYGRCGEGYEVVRVRVNIGGCFVAMGKTREGIRLLREALLEARAGGFRRMEARAWSLLGEAHFRASDHARARKCFRQSDGVSCSAEKYADLVFVNAFYEWKMSREEDNPTREKIAFGRLKALRSGIEKRFPEVEAFDAWVEGGRCHA